MIYIYNKLYHATATDSFIYKVVYILIHVFFIFSETHLPSIKSQLYSPQASTYYRYAGQSSIYSNMEPYASSIIKLQAILLAPGTYDLAARIEISAKVVNSKEYIIQEEKMESICIANDSV